MRPEESFVGQPVRSLQQMLRILAEDDDRYTPVRPDGIYGPETIRAVSNFQRLHGLPVTGVTDQDTWESILRHHESALVRIGEAQSVEIILDPGQILVRGEKSPWLYVAQAMLQVISDVYGSVTAPSHNGILDDATAYSLASFQALLGFPMTGHLDKLTWKHLALHFPLAANLGKGTHQSGNPR